MSNLVELHCIGDMHQTTNATANHDQCALIVSYETAVSTCLLGYHAGLTTQKCTTITTHHWPMIAYCLTACGPWWPAGMGRGGMEGEHNGFH